MYVIEITSQSCLLHIIPSNFIMLQTGNHLCPVNDCKQLMLWRSNRVKKVNQCTSKSPFPPPPPSPDCTCDCNWEVPLSATEQGGTVVVYKLKLKLHVCPLTSLAQSVAAIRCPWDRKSPSLYSILV